MLGVSSAENQQTIDSRTDSFAHLAAGRTTESSNSTSLGEEPNPAPMLLMAGTKIRIVMGSDVSTATCMEGDEFLARTAKDVSSDGSVLLPIGSVIRGRIGSLHPPNEFKRTFMELHFDSLTTPDNRQTALAARVASTSGVAHVHRGRKDIPIIVRTGYLFAPITVSGSPIVRSRGEMIEHERTADDLRVRLSAGAVALVPASGKEIDLKVGDELWIQLTKDLQI